jgi:hypothetical protein
VCGEILLLGIGDQHRTLHLGGCVDVSSVGIDLRTRQVRFIREHRADHEGVT